MVKLLQKPWFRRVWVIQEARVSNLKNAVVTVGNVAVGWVVFGSVLTFLSQKFSQRDKPLKPLSFPLVTFNQGRTNEPQPLLVLLNFTRRFQATNPRDKIWGLIGLVEEASNEKELPACLQPDYSKPLQEVFQGVTVYLINKMMNLQVLSHVQHITPEIVEDPDFATSMPTEQMPSWVARWEAEHFPGNQVIDCDLFKASGDKALQIKIRNREGVLAVKGIKVAEIGFTTEVFQNRNFILMEEDLAKEPIFELYDALQRLDIS
jgi:hypothetical protein